MPADSLSPQPTPPRWWTVWGGGLATFRLSSLDIIQPSSTRDNAEAHGESLLCHTQTRSPVTASCDSMVQKKRRTTRRRKKQHSNCNLETNKAEPSRAVCAPLGSAHLENMLFFVVTLAKCYKPLSGHFVWATIWEQWMFLISMLAYQVCGNGHRELM